MFTLLQKPKNQFASLPEMDRKLILDLCSQHPYHEVVDQLRKPRSEGGLNIVTSRSALCRFFTASQPQSLTVLAQIASAANIHHEQDSNAFLGAIRATVQARVLENLRANRPLADMQHDFKLLRTTESLYLADANFRALHPKTARASYKDHVQRCAEASDSDFVHADDPSAQTNQADFRDLTNFERDVIKERERQDLLNLLKSTARTPMPTTTELIPPANPLKTPVIPHIPLNSTCVNLARPASSSPTINLAPPAPAPTKAKPYIAPPKVNRNDPCPCGSGRKSKKCCHR